MTILVYGYGTMASAMVEGWLRAGMPPAALAAYNPRAKPAPQGVRLSTQPPTEAPDYLLLGFKPAMLGAIAPDIQPLAGDRTTVLSILAGVDLATLRRSFQQAKAVVRFMPNLAVALSKSPNLLIGQGLDELGRTEVTRLAEMLGTAEWLADEALFDVATALAGSGPGFVYRFIDALAKGAAQLGLPHEVAQRLAVQMVEGASALAAGGSDSPQELARKVASPGGMTQQGLDMLDADAALARLVEASLRAARDRGIEMGAAARDTA